MSRTAMWVVGAAVVGGVTSAVAAAALWLILTQPVRVVELLASLK